MKRLILAFQMMTRLPITKQLDVTGEDFARAVLWFFLTSITVGGVMAGTWFLISFMHIPYLSAFLSVLSTAAMTGAFHMDGFADMCDAFFSQQSKERTLEVLRDSRMGVYGVLGLISLVVIKTLAIGHLSVAAIPVLIVTPVCGKISLITCAMMSTYPRNEGLGKYVIDELPKRTAIVSVILCSICVIAIIGMATVYISRIQTIILAGVAVAISIVCGIVVAAASKKKIGGATGDILGTANEVGEMLFLIFMGAAL